MMIYDADIRVQMVIRGRASRGGQIRTGDFLLPKQARYRAAPRPEMVITSTGGTT
jgi:hypothetical protein